MEDWRIVKKKLALALSDAAPCPPGPVEGVSRLPSDGNSTGQGGTRCHMPMA